MSDFEFTLDIPYYEADAPREASAELTAYRDAACRLDIRHCPSRTGLPVLVWFHGGGLTGGERGFPGALAHTTDCVVATADYRLSGQHGMTAPLCLQDAAAAVAWTRRHIAEYGGDPARIYVAGHSAGGYLSAMLLLAPKHLAAFGLSNYDLAGAMPVSGEMRTHFRIIEERVAAGHPQPAVVVDDLAPLGNLPSAPARQLPLLHLYTDSCEFGWTARPEENAYLAAMMRRLGQKEAFCTILPGTTHGTCRAPAIEMILEEIRSRTPAT